MDRRSAWVAMFLAAFLLAGCGGGGGGSSSGGGGIGTLSLSLADAPSPAYNAVYVTVTEVQVHQPGTNENNQRNWHSVDMPRTPMTVNLLDLVNGVREDLGLVDLDEGAYTQMRLIIGQTPERNGAINILSQAHPYANYVIDLNDVYHELKVPSGSQSGYKIVGGFDINANSTTELILDFDANRSVVVAGNSDQWLLKPTVKVKYPDEDALIEGQVTYLAVGVSGTLVSAQVFTAAGPLEDQVAIQASTVTDSNGYYELFVEDGTYTLVVFSPNHATQTKTVTAGPGAVVTENISLASRGMGTFAGSVTIAGAGSEQYATLSFRQTAGSGQVEVYSVNVRDGYTYSVSLPFGDYTIVASSYSIATRSYSSSISVGGTTTVDIAL